MSNILISVLVESLLVSPNIQQDFRFLCSAFDGNRIFAFVNLSPHFQVQKIYLKIPKKSMRMLKIASSVPEFELKK